MHGYITTRREATKTIVFSQFVDPSMRFSMQLVHAVPKNTPEEFTIVSSGVSRTERDEVKGISTASEEQQQGVEDSRLSRSRLQRERAFKTHEFLRAVRPHTPVIVSGQIQARGDAKPDLKVGVEPYQDKYVGITSYFRNIELNVEHIYQLNDFPEHLIAEEITNFPPEQRHLQFRTDRHLRDRIQLRSRVMALARRSLFRMGFDEIETPLLFKSTPEGAREFVVPSRQKGMAYALPQSPQQYKQLLMASGFAKYFQFAKCFRDEDNRADRQPEFTQVRPS